MSFILQKVFSAHIQRMRGVLTAFATGFLVFGALLSPESVSARENEQIEAPNCNDPKHRHYAIRPLTEPTPIRKKEKMRVRRVLM